MSWASLIVKIVLGLAAAILVPTLFYFLAKLGPTPVVPGKQVEAAELALAPEQEKLLEEVRRMEVQFENKVLLGLPSREDLVLLKEVVEGYRQLTHVTRDPPWEWRDKADQLELRRQEYQAFFLREDSLDLERQGLAQQEAGEWDAARFSFWQAHALQLRINTESPNSTAFDPGRATRLARLVRKLEVEPVYRESLRLEQEGVFAEGAGDFNAARQYFLRAHELQLEINRKYRDSPQADLSRATALASRLQVIQAGEWNVRILALQEEGMALEEAGDAAGATARFQEARLQQMSLNERHPNTPFASARRVLELENLLQKAVSRPRLQELNGRLAAADRLLAQRQVYEALEQVPALLREVEALLAEFPENRPGLQEAQLKLRYLDLQQGQVDRIQETVYEGLLPDPTSPDWMWFRTEVPQGLYRQVLGDNPSRVTGDHLPVHRVTGGEAGEFCRRLQWILGVEVRLPQAEEFQRVLGRPALAGLEGLAWGRENSEGKIQPVGSRRAQAGGLHDLAGNVEEWVLAAGGERSDATAFLLAGGGVQDSLEDLLRVPLRNPSGPGRPDQGGFRFLVRRPPFLENLAAATP